MRLFAGARCVRVVSGRLFKGLNMNMQQEDPRREINARFRFRDDADAARMVREKTGAEYTPAGLRAWRTYKNNSAKAWRVFADAYAAVQNNRT